MKNFKKTIIITSFFLLVLVSISMVACSDSITNYLRKDSNIKTLLNNNTIDNNDVKKLSKIFKQNKLKLNDVQKIFNLFNHNIGDLSKSDLTGFTNDLKDIRDNIDHSKLNSFLYDFATSDVETKIFKYVNSSNTKPTNLMFSCLSKLDIIGFVKNIIKASIDQDINVNLFDVFIIYSNVLKSFQQQTLEINPSNPSVEIINNGYDKERITYFNKFIFDYLINPMCKISQQKIQNLDQKLKNLKEISNLIRGSKEAIEAWDALRDYILNIMDLGLYRLRPNEAANILNNLLNVDQIEQLYEDWLKANPTTELPEKYLNKFDGILEINLIHNLYAIIKGLDYNYFKDILTEVSTIIPNLVPPKNNEIQNSINNIKKDLKNILLNADPTAKPENFIIFSILNSVDVLNMKDPNNPTNMLLTLINDFMGKSFTLDGVKQTANAYFSKINVSLDNTNDLVSIYTCYATAPSKAA